MSRASQRCGRHVVVIFHGLLIGGSPQGILLVVKTNAGGLPISGRRCLYFRGVVTLWVVGLLVVANVIFCAEVNGRHQGHDL